MKPLFLLFGLWLSAAPATAAECPRLLNHQYTTRQGGQVNLCDYADPTILVVNTASKCGFTPQFEKLEGLLEFRTWTTRLATRLLSAAPPAPDGLSDGFLSAKSRRMICRT